MPINMHGKPRVDKKVLERVSIECRKTKTKVVTLANHKGGRQSSKPIKTRSNHTEPTQSAGKCARASHDWFWFHFWLVEKVARELWANHWIQSNSLITFATQLKTALNCPCDQKDHFLFFFRFWKRVCLTPDWQNFEVWFSFKGCLLLDFTVRHYSLSKLTDWTSEGWIQGKVMSKAH